MIMNEKGSSALQHVSVFLEESCVKEFTTKKMQFSW